MASKIPRSAVEKISELSISVTGVRIIEDARIMDLTDTHVVLRYRKPRSVKRRQQLFPMSQVLFLRDKQPSAEASNSIVEDTDSDAKTDAEAAPARVCDAIVLDTFEPDERADIATINKLVGTKVFATTVDGHLIIADTSICRFVEDVSAASKAPEVVLGAAKAAESPAAAAHSAFTPPQTPEDGKRKQNRPQKAVADFS